MQNANAAASEGTADTPSSMFVDGRDTRLVMPAVVLFVGISRTSASSQAKQYLIHFCFFLVPCMFQKSGHFETVDELVRGANRIELRRLFWDTVHIPLSSGRKRNLGATGPSGFAVCRQAGRQILHILGQIAGCRLQGHLESLCWASRVSQSIALFEQQHVRTAAWT